MKVVLTNCHWSNHGDEAAIKAIIRELFKIRKEITVEMLIKDKTEINSDIYVDGRNIIKKTLQFLPGAFDYIIQILTYGKIGFNSKMKAFILELKTADYIIYAPGGSVINDRFWIRKQLEYLLPFVIAYLYKKKLFIAAPSIGPFKNKNFLFSLFRRKMLSVPEFFLVRDQISLDSINKQGMRKGQKTFLTIDSAFCDYEFKSFCFEKILKKDKELSFFFSKFKKIVGLTVTDLIWNVKFKEKKELPIQIHKSTDIFISYLQNRGIGVLLIPQLFENQNDEELLSTFSKSNCFILNKNYDSDIQQVVISNLYMLVGYRYHSNIFAAKSATPFIPIIYEEKMEAFIRSFNLENKSLFVDRLNDNSIKEKFEEIEDSLEEYRLKLKSLSQDFIKQADLTKHLLKQFLS